MVGVHDRASFNKKALKLIPYDQKEEQVAIQGGVFMDPPLRKKENVTRMYTVLGDFDNGTTRDEVHDTAKRLGIAMATYPSFNDGKAATDVPYKTMD